jgi:hypothetical protein
LGNTSEREKNVAMENREDVKKKSKKQFEVALQIDRK